jgi:hypothetical protein
LRAQANRLEFLSMSEGLEAYPVVAIPVPPRGAPMGGAGGLQTIAFDVERQLQLLWCWAAVATSVANYYAGASVASQCDVANGVLHKQGCCPPGADPGCNVDGALNEALDKVGHMNPAGWENVLGFNDLLNELISSRPPCLRVQWTSNHAGHFVGVCAMDAGAQELVITDPLGETNHVTWHGLLHGGYRSDGTYTHTYRTVP